MTRQTHPQPDSAAGRFHPARRLVEIANAVRSDPEVPRAELARLLERHGERAEDVGPASFTERDADELREAAVELTEILTQDDPDAVARALNALLAEHAGPPRLSRHDGHPWHLHNDRSGDASWREWFLCSGALALARVLSEYGRPAWGECGAADCTGLFLGTGPGGARRYCSPRCAGRSRVAAHRRRKSEHPNGTPRQGR